ncbi:MAG: DUF58 domain-containing protein [Actinobacteria bacterium]|nr:DUF58 domain-containing protein [Actinomycetota bacterium]
MAGPRTKGPEGPAGVDARAVVGTEATLRQLELRISRKLDGLIHGDHDGRVPGAGSDTGDGRAYQPGDDVRRIDWSLSARSADIQVRDTIAERELETWFVVDASASLDYGTARHEKRDLAVAVIAAFGFLATRAGNRTAAVVFDGERTDLVPPRAGRDAMLALLSRLQRRPRSGPGQASLAAALRRVRHLARRRGLVVVVSDLLDESDWAAELRALGATHDVVVAHLTDPREDELPPVGLLTLVDPETGQCREVQTASRRFRERYARAAASRRDATRAALRSSRAAHLEVGTDRDWLADVVRFVIARRRRR